MPLYYPNPLPVINGGTSKSTKTEAFDSLSPMTTGGDLIYGGASGTGTRLANGSSGQFLKSNGTTTAPTWADASASSKPTIQRFTSGSGTYTTAANVAWIRVKMVGAGGGGGGSSTQGAADGGNGGNGGDSTFGSSLLTAGGGVGGKGSSGAPANGGAGGTNTINSPAITSINAIGGGGGGSNYVATAAAGAVSAQWGGSSALGGAAPGAKSTGSAGQAGATNTGGGGSGGTANDGVTVDIMGCGGGAGAYIEAIITSPSATYSYAIGAAGTAGSAGTSGFAGGAGGSGMIVVEEYYI